MSALLHTVRDLALKTIPGYKVSPKYVKWFVEKIVASSSEELTSEERAKMERNEDLQKPTEENPANLVSSLLENGYHSPLIDIDIPCRVVPSSSMGHSHLYFPSLALEWEEYWELLLALERAGIIEEGNLAHARERKQTLLRYECEKPEEERYDEAYTKTLMVELLARLSEEDKMFFTALKTLTGFLAGSGVVEMQEHPGEKYVVLRDMGDKVLLGGMDCDDFLIVAADEVSEVSYEIDPEWFNYL